MRIFCVSSLELELRTYVHMPYHQNAVDWTRCTIYVGLAQACPNKQFTLVVLL